MPSSAALAAPLALALVGADVAFLVCEPSPVDVAVQSPPAGLVDTDVVSHGFARSRPSPCFGRPTPLWPSWPWSSSTPCSALWLAAHCGLIARVEALDGARRRLVGPQIADVLVAFLLEDVFPLGDAFPLGDVCVVAM